MPSSRDTLVEYGAFHPSPTPFFLDYLSSSGQAARFLGGGRFERADLRAQVALMRPQDRTRLSQILVRQQAERFASPASVTQAERLAEPGSVVVATGQQAGLFGGPLYVAYKALATLNVAAAVEADTGRPVVPLFWIASDDHDFAEIRSTNVPDRSGHVHTVRYSPRTEPAGLPASRIMLDDTIAATIAELREASPPSPHSDEWISRLTEIYAPGASLTDAFARLLAALFPGLVVLDPSGPAVKELMAPVLRRELAEGSPSSRLAMETTERLRAAGYHQQFPVRDGFFNLFFFDGGARRALGSQNGKVEIRSTGQRLELAEAVAALDGNPSLWSPGALLRPLVQDYLLPTIAYIGGPAELAYHAQIGPLYDHFGVNRPAILPRPSLTLVEPSAARTLDAEGLGLTDLQGDLEILFTRWAQVSHPDVEAAFAQVRESLARDMKRVEEKLGSLDPTLRAAADATLGRALHPIGTLHEKATRALKKKEQARADRLRRARELLFPGGVLQERGLSLIGIVTKHGAAVLQEIAERMDPWARGHQVLYL